jgi:hypothetical protein
MQKKSTFNLIDEMALRARIDTMEREAESARETIFERPLFVVRRLGCRFPEPLL